VLAGYLAVNMAVQTRYVLLFWPAVALWAVGVMVDPAHNHSRRIWMVAVALWLIVDSLTVFPALYNRVRNLEPERIFLQAIRTRTAPDAVLGVYAIGGVGFLAPRRVVDLGCIVTPEMRHLPSAQRIEYGIRRGMTHLTVMAGDLRTLDIPEESVLGSAFFWNATWQFPPWRYRQGGELALVPVSAIPDPARWGLLWQ
jgi:hypothetical protein